ncbi:MULTISPECIES: hypothetical protein [Saliphagus]|uniref:Uncharacterized protein n=1 Tax=Saliphagus infecundisoli TaxID=1849069 RepID=A0ABD5QJ71_9EURY|nr:MULTISPECIES: hypothetical protein [Saliphagus]
MSDSRDDPTETTTESREQAAEESAWMVQNSIRIGVFSILLVVVFTLGLMQATGLVDVLAPIADSETGQWIAFGVLAAAAAALGVWAWGSSRENRGS